GATPGSWSWARAPSAPRSRRWPPSWAWRDGSTSPASCATRSPSWRGPPSSCSPPPSKACPAPWCRRWPAAAPPSPPTAPADPARCCRAARWDRSCPSATTRPWRRRSRPCWRTLPNGRHCAARWRATTPTRSSTPPTPTSRRWLVAVRGDGLATQRRPQQQAAGDEDVLLALAAVLVHGRRHVGDLPAVVPRRQQGEGADVVDRGRDPAPVALARGLQAGALDAAPDVAGEAVALAVEDELAEGPGQHRHDLVVRPRLHALEAQVDDGGDDVPEVDRGQQVVEAAAHGEHAARRDERGAALRVGLPEVLERHAAQPLGLSGVGLLA